MRCAPTVLMLVLAGALACASKHPPPPVMPPAGPAPRPGTAAAASRTPWQGRRFFQPSNHPTQKFPVKDPHRPPPRKATVPTLRS